MLQMCLCRHACSATGRGRTKADSASACKQRCEQLKQHNSQLNELVGRLTAENIGLKQQLVGICQQTGAPLPLPPASAVMPPFGFGHMGMPMMPAPKVTYLSALVLVWMSYMGIQIMPALTVVSLIAHLLMPFACCHDYVQML